jgi:hypothetical protein
MLVKFVLIWIAASFFMWMIPRAIHAQICLVLSMPFKVIDDINIYDVSISKMYSPSVLAIGVTLAFYIPFVAIQPFAAPFLHQSICLLLLVAYVVISTVRSYRLFYSMISERGISWPPRKN